MIDRDRALDLAREILHDISTGYSLAGCLDAERAELLCSALLEACADIGPPEPPAEVFTAPAGPPVPCEVCCASIEPGSPVASWVDGERQVVAHAGRCPEPEMWWSGAPECLPRPYEDAFVMARDLIESGWTPSVRLVRVRKEENRG
ncbi:MAG TPA: hypothetical protein VFO62_10585 [Candidatus Binatia bacterium]|nr:hypothetical protein [Candidatus Binatia bacterium]